ncbi:hypothetical protein Ga0074812_14826 [Parafrankia irregularis]|uniref:Uncharacterized protein n=1 Tax=Parafrankia irregularis TaxID=795642 RepID=A0A0S4R221_9ACTN|nr:MULTISPECIES: hypothetical protein [Parafrankia]MBE3206752.1 hypothetical protein [Parafrankia sp. CH37]CUU60826.1 hypothetical protein Ga0074812_14826 [Parafrankia irregularis]
MIATAWTTVFEVRPELLGAEDLWWLTASGLDLEIDTVVAVDSPRQGWTGHGLVGQCPVAVAVWPQPDAGVMQVEFATDAVDEAEHQELAAVVRDWLGDRLVTCWDLSALEASRQGGLRSALAVAADWVSICAAWMACWVAVVLAVPDGLVATWMPLAGGVPDAVAVAAGGWLVREIGRPTADLLDPTAPDRLHDWLDYLRRRAIPLLLAVAVVVLGAGWVA